MTVRLYEISAVVSYAVVVAATSKKDALKHVESWETCWPISSDFCGVSGLEVSDVREVNGDLADVAHEVTATAEAAK